MPAGVKQQKIVFFDFDGVIVDTSEMVYAIRKQLDPSLTFEKFIGYFAGGAREAATGAAAFEETELFNQMYTEHLAREKISDEIRAIIRTLDKKYILAIVSSSRTDIITSYLSSHGLLTCFWDILGSDVETDKSVKINRILQKYHIEPKDSVFVTDTLGDITEANKCNVKAIGVTWGFHAKESLAKGNPATIVSTPKELMATIERLLEGNMIEL